MGQVSEVVAQRDRRQRIDRLRDQQPAGTLLGGGELEDTNQRRRRQMLHDLRHEDPAERTVFERAQILDGVCLFDGQAVTLRIRDHVRVGIDSRASIPASRSNATNSPRPQPMSRTGA